MQLTHTFTVPAGIEQAWEVLLDIERIAPCMPGAALDTVDGDEFTGSVKVRLGPIGLTYRGKARWESRDADSHRAVIDAQGKDARGNGTAKATITATLTDQGSSTEVTVLTDLTITGKPAQFGRGVMVDVGNKLIGQFADCLAGKLAEPAPDEGAAEAADLPPSRASDGADPASGSASDGADPASGSASDGADPASGSASDGADPASGSASDGADPASGSASDGADPASGGAEQEVAATLHRAEAASAERLGTADQELADQPAEQSDAVEQAVSRLDEPGPSSTGSAASPPQRINGAAPAAVTPPAASPVSATSAAAAPPGRAPVAHRPPPRRPMAAEVEPIDLLSSAGPAVAKRLAAPVAALALLVTWLLVRRRR